jgi:hypothetical protein
MFVGIRCDNALSLTLFFSCAFCVMHFTLPNWWSVVIPQSGRHVATLFGLMNGIGVMGALASQGFVGIFVDWQNQHGHTGRTGWDPIFDVYVLALIGAGLAWWTYRFTPLKEEEPAPQEDEGW